MRIYWAFSVVKFADKLYKKAKHLEGTDVTKFSLIRCDNYDFNSISTAV